ncbi:hypothetical protein SCARD494_02701 [Seiridium cardinale]
MSKDSTRTQVTIGPGGSRIDLPSLRRHTDQTDDSKTGGADSWPFPYHTKFELVAQTHQLRAVVSEGNSKAKKKNKMAVSPRAGGGSPEEPIANAVEA